MTTETSSTIYQCVKSGLISLGYTGDLLREGYEFADVLSPELRVKTIPLATFSQEPPSYHNACLGVCIANGNSGPSLVSEYRSLGAPQILEISTKGISLWKILSDDAPKFLDLIEPHQIADFFSERKQNWSPDNIRSIKSMAGFGDYQQDFFDIDTDLMPLLDKEVRSKFIRLLTNMVTHSISKEPKIKDHLPQLFRLIFRLIAAKVLADRKHEGQWLQDNPISVIKEIERYYFQNEIPEPVLDDYETQMYIWNDIRSSFHFQNLSVETLAHVWEDALITPEIRKKAAIHGTPPVIAEYMVRRLPFQDLDINERRVFEPFSGHAVFLVAALRRLRDLLPSFTLPTERHEYFKNMLAGLEFEDFSREIARLSLILADYPNPDGWHLYPGDIFTSDIFERELTKSNIVLCNPPFGTFKKEERAYYKNLTSPHKPVEILNRVLNNPPKLLGFILPRIFISGRGYKEIRKVLSKTYSSIEVIALPDNVFRHSDADTIMLLAYGSNIGRINLTIGQVYKQDLNRFYTSYKPSYAKRIQIKADSKAFENNIWVPELSDIWDTLKDFPRLNDHISQIHRGIEYKYSIKKNKDKVVAKEKRPFFERGLRLVKESLEPFVIHNVRYLNVNPEDMRGRAYTFPWNKPKIIVNAFRKTVGHWRMMAAEDREGLYCTQYFDGIWLKEDVSPEVLSALLNSPLANAYISDHKLSARENNINLIRQIPIPTFSEREKNRIIKLVNEYRMTRERWSDGNLDSYPLIEKCLKLLKLIDGEILQAYNLPPNLEKRLIQYFTGEKRPVPFKWQGYYSEKMMVKINQLQSHIKNVDLSLKGTPEEREAHQIELLEQFEIVRKRANTPRLEEDY